jgi:Transposase DDE domain
MDLDSCLTELDVVLDDWWRRQPARRRRPGRPSRPSPSEVLTLAVVAQWPRWRSERDFWRSARARLGRLFPQLGSQGQFNRQVRAAEPLLRAASARWAARLAGPERIYHVLDTTLIPALQRVRACRHGLFAGQAGFGWCVSKTDWVYGFKVGLSVSRSGVITAFGRAPATGAEHPIGAAPLALDRFGTYLTGTGFAAAAWEARWRAVYRAEVITTPDRSSRRAWAAATYRWAAGQRQVVEQVIDQLKDLFALARHRAKTLAGLLARLAAKIAAFTLGEWLNACHDRPLRHLADLLV